MDYLLTGDPAQNNIPDAEWEAVKADQLRRFYRDHSAVIPQPVAERMAGMVPADAEALRAARAIE